MVNEVLHYVLNHVNEVLYTVYINTSRISYVWEDADMQVMRNSLTDNEYCILNNSYVIALEFNHKVSMLQRHRE